MAESESSFISHIPCESCGSSDGNALYDDGHTFCHVCENYEEGTEDVPKETQTVTPKNTSLLSGSPTWLKKRHISEETCTKWKYHVGTYKGKKVQIANYCNERGVPIAQKLRFANKDFLFIGDTKNAGLYGMHLWRDGGKKIVITEGEIDALSVSQLQGHKWPVVSVPTGSKGAKRELSKQLEQLERFEEIILMFDDDEPGRLAIEECVTLFTPGKCKVARIEGFKDANAALQAGEGSLVIDAIWAAKVYRPDGIMSALEVRQQERKPVTMGLSWPWEELTKLTYGIRPNEMIAYGAGTGVGKTDNLKQIIAHLIKVHGEVCGTLLFEEPDLHLTVDSVAGKMDRVLYHVPDQEFDEEQLEKSRDLIDDKLFMYKVGGMDIDRDSLLSTIRYLVVTCGCTQIFLDHITYMMDAEDDERQLEAQKKLMRKLNDINKELPFTLHYVSHLRKATNGRKPHEEGGRVYLDDFVGGKASTQYANFTIAFERDQQGEDKNLSQLRILKDRYTGEATGEVLTLKYDPKTGTKTVYEDNPFGDSTEQTEEEF